MNWSAPADVMVCKLSAKVAEWQTAWLLKGYSAMLNFAPTQEQEEIRQLAQSLAMEQVRPQGRSAEQQGDISPALMKTLTQTGLTTPFPEEYGGSGVVEAVTYTLIAEELGFGDGALAMNIIGSLMGPLTVLLAGDKSQQQHYITPFSDASRGHLQRGSLGFAERTGGYYVAKINATIRNEGGQHILYRSNRGGIQRGAATPRPGAGGLAGKKGTQGLCALLVPPDIA